MKVLVTGANGFIGSHLCEGLLANGYEVRALVRKTSDLRWIKHLNMELVYGDITDEGSLIPAVDGIEIVFHTAAVVRPKRVEEFIRVNQEGTERLARVAIDKGVKRFVLFSSVAAAGPGRFNERLNEEMAPKPVSEYGRAKLAAEEAVLALKDSLSSVVLRLPAVYGPRDRDGLLFWRMFSRGFAPVLGGTFSLLYVSDAVAAAILAARLSPSAFRIPPDRPPIYFISDGCCYTFFDLVRVWEMVTGRRVRTFRIPHWLGFLAAQINSWLAREGTVFNPDKMRELTQECWVCSDERAKVELGFSPRITLQRGAELTLNWYKKEGWL
ncbi:MAG: NAD-dependent epimerase/dehydratase family protein [candidate division WOR-3 bacterium]